MKALMQTANQYRQAVRVWRDALPVAKETTETVLQELRESTAQLLDKRAEAWMSENKLIHAGAAQKLAKELRDQKQ